LPGTPTIEGQEHRKFRFDARLDLIISRLQNGAPGDMLLGDRDLALIFDCSASHLAALRSTGGGPPFVRTGNKGRCKYRLADVRAWILARRFNSTAEYGAPTTKIVDFEPMRQELRTGIERSRQIAKQFLDEADRLAHLLEMINDEPASTTVPESSGP
jgi:hypothetical protein